MSSSKIITEGFNHLRMPRSKQEFIRQLNDVNMSDISFEDRLSLIVDAEITSRRSNRIDRKIREAQFKIKARPELINYDSARLTLKNHILSLLTANFIDLRQNILISGPTGVGKSYLATAIGVAACENEYTVRYFKLSNLQEKLTISRLDGTYQKLAVRLKTYDLLIIDDFGLSPIGMINSREILDILDERLNFKSTLIASQIPSEAWHSIIEDQTTADAIIDRLIHDSINLKLTGESYRKLKAMENNKEIPDLEN